MKAREKDLQEQRERMVARQIKARGVYNSRVLDAMRRVPRHLFIPPSSRCRAYDDHPVPISAGQTISQPYIVGLMTELLNLAPTDRVLEIGTGSAYQAAILAELAAEVVTIERHEELADAARLLLEDLGYENVEVIVGDGTLGCASQAPFDAILVTAAAPEIPETLSEQLAMGGRLVCPIGTRSLQTLVRLTRFPEGLQETRSIPCVFVPLIGAEGWPS